MNSPYGERLLTPAEAYAIISSIPRMSYYERKKLKFKKLKEKMMDNYYQCIDEAPLRIKQCWKEMKHWIRCLRGRPKPQPFEHSTADVLLHTERFLYNRTHVSFYAGKLLDAVIAETNERVTLQSFDVHYANDRYRNADASWLEYKYMVLTAHTLMKLAKNHPHVVQCVDVEFDQYYKKAYLVFEDLSGYENLCDYSEKIKNVLYNKLKNPQFNENRSTKCVQFARERFAMEVIRQIVSALGFYHVHLIAHRNLLMRNIFLNVQAYTNRYGVSPYDVMHPRWTCPSIKILGFEFAGTFFQNDVEHSILNRLGSQWLRSPEVIRMKPAIASATDLWQIGMLAYRLVVGEFPFASMRKEVRQYNFLASNKRHDCYPLMSEYFTHFLDRCLDKDQYKRANIHEIATHPWLNSLSRPVADVRNMLPLERPHLYSIRKLFDPIDYYLPLERFQKEFTSLRQFNTTVIDELRQGYYGWSNTFDVEEVESEFALDYLARAMLPMKYDPKEIPLVLRNEVPYEPMPTMKLSWTKTAQGNTKPTTQEQLWYNKTYTITSPFTALYLAIIDLQPDMLLRPMMPAPDMLGTEVDPCLEALEEDGADPNSSRRSSDTLGASTITEHTVLSEEYEEAMEVKLRKDFQEERREAPMSKPYEEGDDNLAEHLRLARMAEAFGLTKEPNRWKDFAEYKMKQYYEGLARQRKRKEEAALLEEVIDSNAH